MKKLVAMICVAAVVAVAVYVSTRTSSPPPVEPPSAKLDLLIAQCDAQGSSFPVIYDRVAAPLTGLIGSDRAKALAVAKGQVANLIAGRLATCEQALAIAQHDRQGIAVVKLGSYTRRVAVANAALRHLEDVLEGSGDAGSALEDLGAAAHAATRP